MESSSTSPQFASSHAHRSINAKLSAVIAEKINLIGKSLGNNSVVNVVGITGNNLKFDAAWNIQTKCLNIMCCTHWWSFMWRLVGLAMQKTSAQNFSSYPIWWINYVNYQADMGNWFMEMDIWWSMSNSWSAKFEPWRALIVGVRLKAHAISDLLFNIWAVATIVLLLLSISTLQWFNALSTHLQNRWTNWQAITVNFKCGLQAKDYGNTNPMWKTTILYTLKRI